MTRRIAIIGLGMAVTPHAKALMDLTADGRCEVAAAMAPSAERRAAFGASYPFPTTADLDAVMAGQHDPSGVGPVQIPMAG